MTLEEAIRQRGIQVPQAIARPRAGSAPTFGGSSAAADARQEANALRASEREMERQMREQERQAAAAVREQEREAARAARAEQQAALGNTPEVSALRTVKSRLGEVEKYHRGRVSEFDSAAGKLLRTVPGEDLEDGPLANLEALEKQATAAVGTVMGALTPGVSAGDPTDKARAARDQLDDLVKQAQAVNPDVRSVNDLRTFRESLRQQRTRIAQDAERAAAARAEAEKQYGAELSKLYQPAIDAIPDKPVIVPAAEQLQARPTKDEPAEVGTFRGIANAAQNAFDSARQALMAMNGLDDNDAAEIARLEFAKAARASAPGYDEYQRAEGMDAVRAFIKNPIEVTTNIVAEGLAGSIPILASGLATGGAGAAAAGAAGSVVPGVGNVIGAAGGFTAGLVAGTGAGSFAVEYGGKILEELQKAGMDMTSPESITTFFADEAALAAAKDKALKRGVPVAAFDAISAGLAGRLGSIAKTALRTPVRTAVAEVATQGALGGAGEVAGSLAAGDEVSGKAVFGEIVGEVGPGGVEIAAGRLAQRRPAPAAKPPPAGEAPPQQGAVAPQPTPVAAAPVAQSEADAFTPALDPELEAELANLPAGMEEGQSAPTEPAPATPAPGFSSSAPEAEPLSQEPPVGDVAAQPVTPPAQKPTPTGSTPEPAITREPAQATEAETQGVAGTEPVGEAPAPVSQRFQLPRDLAGAKPRYSYGSKQFDLSFESDLDKALYVIAQKTPSKRDADYLKSVMDHLGVDEDRARRIGATVRDAIKARAKDSPAGKLTVPTLAPSRAAPVSTAREDASVEGGEATGAAPSRPPVSPLAADTDAKLANRAKMLRVQLARKNATPEARARTEAKLAEITAEQARRQSLTPVPPASQNINAPAPQAEAGGAGQAPIADVPSAQTVTRPSPEPASAANSQRVSNEQADDLVRGLYASAQGFYDQTARRFVERPLADIERALDRIRSAGGKATLANVSRDSGNATWNVEIGNKIASVVREQSGRTIVTSRTRDATPSQPPASESDQPQAPTTTPTPEPAQGAGQSFEQAVAQRDAIEAEVRAADAALKAIPGVGSGASGLTPDSVKSTPAYAKAKADFDRAFAKQRKFNQSFTRQFKAELAAERSARRPAVDVNETPSGARQPAQPRTDASQAQPTPIVPRGKNTPAEFVKRVAAATGIPGTDAPMRAMLDLSARLNKAAPEAFRGMEVYALSEAEWRANPATGNTTPDSAAAYNPETNTLYLRTERVKVPTALVSAIVHESGHFAERFALPEALIAREWAKLDDAQIENAAADYNPDDTRTAAQIRQDPRARSEWVAQQFARVVAGKARSVPAGIRARLEAFFAAMKEFATKWLGSEFASSPAFDAEVLRVMGFNSDGMPVAESAPAPAAAPAQPVAEAPVAKETPTKAELVAEIAGPVPKDYTASLRHKETVNRLRKMTIEQLQTELAGIKERNTKAEALAAKTSALFPAVRDSIQEAGAKWRGRLKDIADAVGIDSAGIPVAPLGEMAANLARRMAEKGVTEVPVATPSAPPASLPATAGVTSPQAAAETAPNGPVFNRDEIAVSTPRTSRRKRANGTDGEVTIEITSPNKVTQPENWSRLADTNRLRAQVEARLDFATGKAPKKADSSWDVIAQGKVIRRGLTQDAAIEVAKDFVMGANAGVQSAPAPVSTTAKERREREATRAEKQAIADAAPIPPTPNALPFSEARRALLAQVDEAIAKAPTAADFRRAAVERLIKEKGYRQPTNAKTRAAEEERIRVLSAEIANESLPASERRAVFRSGTSTYRITNTREALEQFRKMVAAPLRAITNPGAADTVLPSLTADEKSQIEGADTQGQLDDPTIRSLLDRATEKDLEKLGLADRYTRVAPGIVMPKEGAEALARLRAGEQAKFDVLGTPAEREGEQRFRQTPDTARARGYEVQRQELERRGQAPVIAEVKAYTAAYGIEAAARRAIGLDPDTANDLRSALGNEVLRVLRVRANEAKGDDHVTAVAALNRFMERYAPRNTDVARGLAMMNRLEAFTEQGALNTAVKNAKKRQDTMLGQDGITTEREIVQAVNTENGKILEALLNEVKADMNKVKVTKPMIELAEGQLPKNKRELDAAIRSAFTKANLRMTDILRAHYTEVDAIGTSLVDKLVNEVGLTKADAETLAEAVRLRVEKKTKDAKQRVLERLGREKGGISRRMFTLVDKIVEMSNAGALDDAALRGRIAEELKLPRVTDDLVAKLKALTDKRLKMEPGDLRDRVDIQIQDELRKVQGIGPVDVFTAIYYAHILSGYTTQILNIISTGFNVAADVANATLRAEMGALLNRNGLPVGSASYQAAVGLLTGAQMGLTLARATLSSGYSRKAFDAKLPEVSNILEILSREPASSVGGKALSNYAKLARYVTRTMKAADAVFARSASEARQRLIAAKLATAGRTMSRQELNQRIRDDLRMSPAEWENARKQAESEGLTGADLGLRTQEIIFNQRDAKALAEGDRLAMESTFNSPPRGAIGELAKLMGQFGNVFPPFKLFVPFTNIVANVTNASLNYSPVGALRAGTGDYVGQFAARMARKLPGGERLAKFAEDVGALNKGGYWGEAKMDAKEREAAGIPSTEEQMREERQAMAVKALGGTSAMIALLALGLAGSDDEEDDGTAFITGKGPTDFARLAQLRAAGWQPYTIRWPNGTRTSYLPYSTAIPFAFVGNLVDGVRYNGLSEADLATMMIRGAIGAASTITDMSFVSGVTNLMDVLRDNKGAKAERWAAGVATSTVMPNLVRQFDRLIDPTVYESTTFGEAIQSAIPGARQQLQPRITPLAEPISNAPLTRFGGFKPEDTAVLDVLNAKGIVIREPGATTKIGNRVATEPELRRITELSGPRIMQRLRSALPMIRSARADAADALVDRIVREERQRARDAVAAQPMVPTAT